MALHLNSRKYLVDDTARESLHYFRQFRAVTAVLIIEDAEQNRRSNFPRKRAGCRGLSKRIDLEYSIPPAIFRNGYSIFTMVDKRTGEPRAEKKKNSRSAAYEVLANIQRLKGGCCLESGRFRGFKKEGGAPRSIFAYELRATSDISRNFFPCEYILWPRC